MRPIIVCFHQDLRVADHPALHAAAGAGAPVVPVYVLDEDSADVRALGGASRWWLHHSLERLTLALAQRGLRLLLRRGPRVASLLHLAREAQASAVWWTRSYAPQAAAQEIALQAGLAAHDIAARRFSGSLLFEPEALRTASGEAYKVFTPFWKASQHLPVHAPLPAPTALMPCSPSLSSDALHSWALLPRRPDWAGGLRTAWTPGMAGAQARMETLLGATLSDYPEHRDRPDLPGSSRLSPHLHHGEISVRALWYAVEAARREARNEGGALAFQRQLLWREYSYHLLYHAPQLPQRPLRRAFERFPWQEDRVALQAWQRGRTGYPFVDAGMRELWQTGWMHNRVRMVTASFLVKHLLQPWTAGERWFWDTLVDADLANNAASWQWVAGCGTDAAPYFRVFNPVLQGRKFDPDGHYVRRWLPELAQLPAEHVHAPWLAPASALARAGVRLGANYPEPIVDHAAARARALAAFQRLREA